LRHANFLSLNADTQAAGRELIDKLPDNATWDDVVYEMAVRRSIERGLADADAGRLTDVKYVRRSFGLPE
jgi:predicted transcriptional regulator